MLSALLAVIGLGACSSTGPQPSPDLGLGSQSLTLDGPSARWHIRAHSIQRASVESDPVTIASGQSLEFVPLASNSSVERIDAYAIVNGREELLSSATAVSLDSDTVLRHPGAALSNGRVRIDLRPYLHETIRFKWVVKGTNPSAKVFLGGAQLSGLTHAVDRAPDVLMVCSDTHRYDYSANESEVDLMPFLRSLSKERQTVVYRQAFSTASWTLPAIASAMTGLSPRYHRTGQRGDPIDSGNQAKPPEGGQFPFGDRLFSAYAPSIVSLSDRLSEVGYNTAVVASNPLYFLSGLAFDGNDIAVDTGTVPGDQVNEAALKAVASADPDEPLFLLVHYVDVHQWEPWYLKEDSSSQAQDPEERRQQIRESYSRAVQDVDRFLQRLIESWSIERDWNETFFVFFSDHGEHLVDPDEHNPSHMLRIGHGNSMSDTLLKIPLVIKYPSSMQPSSPTSDQSVSLVDLTPTILDVVGIDYDPKSLSGIPLPKLGVTDETRALFADFQLYGDSFSSVRSGPYKAVINLSTDELLLSDWTTQAPVEGDTPDQRALVTNLSEDFESYRSAGAGMVSDASNDEGQIDSSQRQIDQLKSLGYIQ